MVPELMPEAVGGIGPAFCRAKQSLIVKADGVVAVSATTAADIARLTGRPIDDIQVIHHGVSHRMRWSGELGEPPALPARPSCASVIAALTRTSSAWRRRSLR